MYLDYLSDTESGAIAVVQYVSALALGRSEDMVVLWQPAGAASLLHWCDPHVEDAALARVAFYSLSTALDGRSINGRITPINQLISYCDSRVP